MTLSLIHRSRKYSWILGFFMHMCVMKISLFCQHDYFLSLLLLYWWISSLYGICKWFSVPKLFFPCFWMWHLVLIAVGMNEAYDFQPGNFDLFMTKSSFLCLCAVEMWSSAISRLHVCVSYGNNSLISCCESYWYFLHNESWFSPWNHSIILMDP